MDTWEYLQFKAPIGPAWTVEENHMPRNLDEFLDERGAEGWELVAMAVVGDGAQCVMKRPRPPGRGGARG